MWRVDIQKDGQISRSFKRTDDKFFEFLKYLNKPRDGRYPILVKSSLAYGDALILSPAIKALRTRFPGSPIHLITTDRGRLIFLHNPSVDVIIVTNNRNFKRSGQIARYYLHSYDMGRWMVETDALIENSYELGFRKLLLEPEKVMSPSFYCTAEEEERTRAELASCGIQIGKDKIVLIQSESSAMMRRWPLEHVFSLAKVLSARGLSVIVAGSQKFLKDANPPEISNVYYTCRELEKLSTREGFLLTKYADIVCTVDSVYSHLALVYQRPTVLLYGTLRGELLSAPFFNQAYVLQRDLPCGPCHQHHGKCIVEPQAYSSPCMRAISPNDVIKAIDRLIVGVVPKRKFTPIVQRDNVQGECPVCKDRNFEFRARKSDKFYLACSRCGTVYWSDPLAFSGDCTTLKSSKQADQSQNVAWFPQKSAILHAGEVTKRLSNEHKSSRCLLVGTDLSVPLLKLIRASGWDCHLYDPERGILKGWTGVISANSTANMDEREVEDPNYYTAVFAIGGITQITKPNKFVEFVEDVLLPNGILVVQSPVADYCILKESKPFNTPIIGQNIFIPSIKGLDMLIGSNGYEMVYNSRVWATKYQTMIWRKNVTRDSNPISKDTSSRIS